jgi:membrane-bound lytic murein transglycosylase D
MKTMLKFKCFSQSRFLPLICPFLVLAFTGVGECKAQMISSVPPNGLSAAAVVLTDTMIVKTIVRDLKNEVIDATKIVAPPAIKLNRQAEKFVTNYLTTNEAELTDIQKRSVKFFKTIDVILGKCNVPAELKYLAVIESRLRTSAVSRVGAVGMWQFMPATARSLGLKVSAASDERKQFIKSTKAAATYIKALHAQFDDWLLVVAAYNSGAGTVYKAIKRSGSRNFWALEKFLPAETRAHVKRYIGAHYFFENKGSAATLTKTETLIHLKAVAEYNESLKVIEEVKHSLTNINETAVQTDNPVGNSARIQNQ